MKAEQKIKNLKNILLSIEEKKEQKKGVSNEITGIRESIREAIMSEDDSINLKQLLQQEINQESYRSQVNSQINQLQAVMYDVIAERGEYDPDQLSLLDQDEEEFFKQTGKKSEPVDKVQE